MKDGEMSQEEIDKLLNGGSDEKVSNVQEESINDTNTSSEGENSQDSVGEMSQEEIDKLVNGGLEEEVSNVHNEYINGTDATGGENNVQHSESEMSQEDIDNLLKSAGEGKEEFTQDSIDSLLRMASNNLSQSDLDRILQEAYEKEQAEANMQSQSPVNFGANKDEFQQASKARAYSKIKEEKSQIDLLEEEKQRRKNASLTEEEKDVIAELMVISYNEASTTLTALLGKKAFIKNPVIEEVSERDVKDGGIPHVIVKIHYTKGLELENTLVFKKEDAFYISDAMMGAAFSYDDNRELNEMEFSAIKEAINQMIGKSASAMFQVLQKPVDISPPEVKVEPLGTEIEGSRGENKRIVRISMDLEMGSSVKSKIYQLMSIDNAKKMANLILNMRKKEEEVYAEKGNDDGSNGENYYVNPLFKNVEVKLELVYGTTRKTLKEFLSLDKNDVIELTEEIYEPLKLYANGILVAEGDLVNADGYYGVKIKKIV